MKKTYFDYFGGETPGSPEGQGGVGSPAAQAEASGSNLRLSQRIPIGMRIKVQNKDGVEEFAVTRDVSNRGLCFVSSKPFKVDEEVRVELHLDRNRKIGPLLGRILWVLPAAEAWQHGVAWSKKVDLDLVTTPPAASAPKQPNGGGAS